MNYTSCKALGTSNDSQANVKGRGRRVLNFVKNDTVRYFDELVEAFGGIKGYRKIIEFSHDLSTKHSNVEEIRVMKNDLSSTSDILRFSTPMILSVVSIFSSILFSIIVVMLSFYFNLQMRFVEIGSNIDLNILNGLLIVILLFTVLLFYLIVKSMILNRKINTYITICELAEERT